MRRGLPLLLAAVATLSPSPAAALAPLASGDLPAGPGPFYLGVSGDPYVGRGDLDRMGSYSASVYRFPLSMRRIDRHSNGLYDWGAIDRLVAAAARSGIRLQPMVFRALKRRPDPPRTEGERGAWRRFVEAAVARYGARGHFWLLNPLLPRRPIDSWQVWNEPNLKFWWDGQPNPRGYAGLLRSTAAVIRRADPGATVVLAGLSGTARGRQSPAGYLGELYDFGAADDFDVAAIHPYARRPRGSRRKTLAMWEAMRRSGDTSTPVWITEVGWSTSGEKGEHYLITDAAGQARKLKRTYVTARRLRAQMPLQEVLWYSWRDTTRTAGCGWCPGTGLIQEDGTAKEAADEFALAALLFD